MINKIIMQRLTLTDKQLCELWTLFVTLASKYWLGGGGGGGWILKRDMGDGCSYIWAIAAVGNGCSCRQRSQLWATVVCICAQ